MTTAKVTGTLRQEATFTSHTGRIRTACALPIRDGDLIASAGDDRIIRIWDTRNGEQRLTLQGHTNCITAICLIRIGNHVALASTSQDGTARIGSTVTGWCLMIIPVQHETTSCTGAADQLIIGTTAGALAITLNIIETYRA